MSNAFSFYGGRNKARYFAIALTSTLVALGVGVQSMHGRAARSDFNGLPALLPVNEASGMAASRQYPGVMWWIRDGGPVKQGKPRNALYAVKFDNQGNMKPVRDGATVPSYPVSGDENTDWEDIAIDGASNIWIGEIGANDCKSAQHLYRLSEPNPESDTAGSIQASYTLRFPDPLQGCSTHNAEAMFWLDGKLYIFAKAKGSPVYRVDLPSGNSGEAKLVKLGELKGINRISGVSLSDDRKRLMVQHHQKFFILTSSDTKLRGDAFMKDMISRTYKWHGVFGDGNGTVEGGSFVRGSYDLAFVSESRQAYYVPSRSYADGTAMASGQTGVVAVPGGATVTPPQAAPQVPCTITEKLVNPCRPWLGAAANKYPVQENYQAQIEAHETAIGRKVDIAHTYHPVGSNTLSAADKYFASRANTYLFTNWKPAGKWADARGGNQVVEEAIDTMAESVKSLGKAKIFMTLHHEPENDVSGGGGGCDITYKGDAGTPADYRAMWAHVHKRFNDKGVNNVVWVMDYMNYPRWDCLIDDLYPGNDLVDWVMFNAYGHGTGAASNAKKNVGHFIGQMQKYQSSTIDFASKPWGVVEWNSHDMPAEVSYKYYADMEALANEKIYPNIRAYMVFDSIGPEGNDNRVAFVDGKPDTTRLSRYKSFANSGAFKPVTAASPIKDESAPSMPVGLAMTARTTDSISITWSPSRDNVGVAGYRVYSNGQEVAKVAQTAYTGTGLYPGLAYSFRVAAYDAAGNVSVQSGAIVASTVLPPNSSLPSEPAGLRAEAHSPTEARLSWNAASGREEIAKYLIQRDGVTIARLAATRVAYDDNALAPQSSYTYAVRAVNLSGEVSPVKQTIRVATPAAPDTAAPDKVRGLTAIVTGGQVNLKWLAAHDNIGVKGYVIYRDGYRLAESKGVSFGDGSIRLAKGYSYSVAARDAAGNTGSRSEAAKVTIPAATARPHVRGLAVTYFNNQTLSGRGLSQTDNGVDYDWGEGAPLPGIPSDNFSARWTGRIIAPASGEYVFYTEADDGARLYIDDKLVINDWQDGVARERQASVRLEKGARYNIKLEYYENTGLALMKLSWRQPGGSKQIIPAGHSVTSSYGLTGSYFAGVNLKNLVGSRTDSQVDFSWSGSPFGGVAADGFSARWTGRIYISQSDTYTFHTVTNDGARLWVNGKLLVNDWKNQGSTENSGSIKLLGGKKYDIAFEYYDNSGQGVSKLLWSSPILPRQLVPQGVLYDR